MSASETRALRMALLYAACAALWILFSDQLLNLMGLGPALMTWIATLKGWLFVLVTSTLLYVTLRRAFRRESGAPGTGLETSGELGVRSGMGLRSRLVWLVAVVLVPMLGLVVLTGWESRQDERRRAELAAETVLDSVNARLEVSVTSAEELLTALAHLPELRQLDAEGWETYLRQVLHVGPHYTNLGVLTTAGNVVASAVPFDDALNLAAQGWFQQALAQDGTVVEQFDISGAARRPVLLLARSVRAKAGPPSMVLLLAVDLSWLNDVATIASSPPGSVLTLMDRHGRVLTRSLEPDQWVGAQVWNLPLVRTMLAERMGVVESDGMDGIHRVYLFGTALASHQEVLLSLGIPRKQIYGSATRMVVHNLSILAAVTLLAVLAAWAFAHLTVLQPTGALVRAAQRIAAGERQARSGVPYHLGELGALARSFDEMASALERRTMEGERSLGELRQSQERLQALTGRLHVAREEERASLARAVHDQLGQALTGIKLDLAWVRRHLEKVAGDPFAELLAKLGSVGRHVDETIGTVRAISTELRPGILDDLGLTAALEWQAQEFSERAGVACVMAATTATADVPPSIAIVVFRIYQELLTNVARHAGASRVWTRLERSAQGLQLVVADNGRGITAAQVADVKSIGLIGIRERTAVLGGQVEFQGEPGKGTTVTVSVPLAKGSVDARVDCG